MRRRKESGRSYRLWLWQRGAPSPYCRDLGIRHEFKTRTSDTATKREHANRNLDEAAWQDPQEVGMARLTGWYNGYTLMGRRGVKKFKGLRH